MIKNIILFFLFLSLPALAGGDSPVPPPVAKSSFSTFKEVINPMRLVRACGRMCRRTRPVAAPLFALPVQIPRPVLDLGERVTLLPDGTVGIRSAVNPDLDAVSPETPVMGVLTEPSYISMTEVSGAAVSPPTAPFSRRGRDPQLTTDPTREEARRELIDHFRISLEESLDSSVEHPILVAIFSPRVRPSLSLALGTSNDINSIYDAVLELFEILVAPQNAGILNAEFNQILYELVTNKEILRLINSQTKITVPVAKKIVSLISNFLISKIEGLLIGPYRMSLNKVGKLSIVPERARREVENAGRNARKIREIQAGLGFINERFFTPAQALFNSHLAPHRIGVYDWIFRFFSYPILPKVTNFVGYTTARQNLFNTLVLPLLHASTQTLRSQSFRDFVVYERQNRAFHYRNAQLARASIIERVTQITNMFSHIPAQMRIAIAPLLSENIFNEVTVNDLDALLRDLNIRSQDIEAEIAGLDRHVREINLRCSTAEKTKAKEQGTGIRNVVASWATWSTPSNDPAVIAEQDTVIRECEEERAASEVIRGQLIAFLAALVNAIKEIPQLRRDFVTLAAEVSVFNSMREVVSSEAVASHDDSFLVEFVEHQFASAKQKTRPGDSYLNRVLYNTLLGPSRGSVVILGVDIDTLIAELATAPHRVMQVPVVMITAGTVAKALEKTFPALEPVFHEVLPSDEAIKSALRTEALQIGIGSISAACSLISDRDFAAASSAVVGGVEDRTLRQLQNAFPTSTQALMLIAGAMQAVEPVVRGFEVGTLIGVSADLAFRLGLPHVPNLAIIIPFVPVGAAVPLALAAGAYLGAAEAYASQRASSGVSMVCGAVIAGAITFFLCPSQIALSPAVYAPVIGAVSVFFGYCVSGRLHRGNVAGLIGRKPKTE